jgi:hypothetical protein
MLTRQNKSALELDSFFTKNFNANNLATTADPATQMALAFKEQFAEELGNTKGNIEQAFDNIISGPAFDSFSAETKAKMREIFSESSKGVAPGSDATAYWEAFIQACQEAGDEAQSIIADVTASLFDSWNSTLSSIISAEQAAA